MDTVIIETAVSIVANLAVTLIGVLGAWLLSRIAKTQQLSTIGTAVGELTAAAEQTVLELQQTVVDGLKAASADGKLTQDEINDLGKKLIDGTMAKMSDTGIGVLKAANVDINAIITGAGEALIAKMKAESPPISCFASERGVCSLSMWNIPGKWRSESGWRRESASLRMPRM